jgi:lipoprotein signal peptidase
MKTNNSIHRAPAVATNRIAGLSFLAEAAWRMATLTFVVAVLISVWMWIKEFYPAVSYYVALIGGA